MDQCFGSRSAALRHPAGSQDLDPFAVNGDPVTPTAESDVSRETLSSKASVAAATVKRLTINAIAPNTRAASGKPFHPVVGRTPRTPRTMMPAADPASEARPVPPTRTMRCDRNIDATPDQNRHTASAATTLTGASTIMAGWHRPADI